MVFGLSAFFPLVSQFMLSAYKMRKIPGLCGKMLEPNFHPLRASNACGGLKAKRR
jgi:hypothetical protein